MYRHRDYGPFSSGTVRGDRITWAKDGFTYVFERKGPPPDLW
jgi:hypothetical protein